MVNLFKDSPEDKNYIIGRQFSNSELYKSYLDHRLFCAFEEQTIFCPSCGTFPVKSRIQESQKLNYCPRCGNERAFFIWEDQVSGHLKLDVLINRTLQNSIEMVLMLTAVAKSHSIELTWFFSNNGKIQQLKI